MGLGYHSQQLTGRLSYDTAHGIIELMYHSEY